MGFDVPKIHKWSDNIEDTLTTWALEHTLSWYDINEITELTSGQIEEIELFLADAEETWYSWVLIGFRNMLNNLQYEQEDYDI